MIPLEQLPIWSYMCYKIDFMCHKGVKGCRYWIDDFDLGCCVLRCDREHGQRELAKSMGVSFQAIQNVEERAYIRVAKEFAKIGRKLEDIIPD